MRRRLRFGLLTVNVQMCICLLFRSNVIFFFYPGSLWFVPRPPQASAKKGRRRQCKATYTLVPGLIIEPPCSFLFADLTCFCLPRTSPTTIKKKCQTNQKESNRQNRASVGLNCVRVMTSMLRRRHVLQVSKG